MGFPEGGPDAPVGAVTGHPGDEVYSVHKRFRSGELSQMEAAELLGISDRTFRRWLERFGEEGPRV